MTAAEPPDEPPTPDTAHATSPATSHPYDSGPPTLGLPRYAAEYGDDVHPFRREPRPPFVRRAVPLVADLRRYPRRWLRGDLMAGLIVSAVAVPQALGYAQIAGVSPVAGLYALTVPVVVFALLTSSRVLAVGPTTTAALLVTAAVAPLADGDPVTYATLTALLALLTGAFLVVASIMRLGWLADYLSSAVLVGFLTGLGLTLIAGQLDELLGVPAYDGDAWQQAVHAVADIPDAQPATVAVTVSSLVLLTLGSRFLPKFPTILLVALLGMLAGWTLDLAAHGVVLVGEIPSGLPSFDLPTAPLGDLLVLIPAAAGIGLVAFADAILTARAFAGQRHETVDANQELLSLGGLNIAAGLFQSFPLGSSGSRTAVNARSGGRSQVFTLVQVVVVLAVLLFLTEPIGYLPKAVLGSIIVFAAAGLVDIPAWRKLREGSRAEFGIALVTAVGMLSVGLLAALGIAVVLSVFDVARRSAQPHDAVLGWSPKAGRFVNVSLHPNARLVPGTVVYRLDDRLFFANAQYFRERVREAIAAAPYDVERFVLVAEAVTHVDGAGADALREVVSDLEASGIEFVVARLKGSAMDKFDQFGLVATIGEDRFFPTTHKAVFGTTEPPTPGSFDASGPAPGS